MFENLKIDGKYIISEYLKNLLIIFILGFFFFMFSRDFLMLIK